MVEGGSAGGRTRVRPWQELNSDPDRVRILVQEAGANVLILPQPPLVGVPAEGP